MHQIILCQRHSPVEHGHFQFAEVHRMNGLAIPDGIERRLDVKGVVAFLNIHHNHLAGYRPVRIERQIWLRAVAISATALLEDCKHSFRFREIL